jgi:2-polyprenyl-3-methyl-5-hydroxy-6-metoxy-1,4-benzoquinol methylase
MSDRMVERPVDPDELGRFSFLVFSKLEGAMTSAMIHLGDRLGLYRALAAAVGPLSSVQLATATGLDERWVREWLFNQAAARLVESDDGSAFSMSAEAVAVLADPDSAAFGMGEFHQLPQTMGALGPVAESFRSGLGHDYDSHGAEGALAVELGFGPWNRANLLPVVVPALDGMVARLDRGVSVADVGCGAGALVLLLAERFPASTFAGYDISQHALRRAEQRLAEEGLTNVSFHDPRSSPLPADHSIDLISTFDCIHDMTHPQEMIGAIRAALADDGTWLLVDIKARESFSENVAKNPMAALMYGISVMSCMSSALSAPGGAGLGTLGLPPSRAEAMAREAGFTRFRKLDVDHPVNAFYEIRP